MLFSDSAMNSFSCLQIASIVEDNNVLNETYQKTKNDFQSEILRLEEKLKEQSKVEESLRSEIENLKADIAENNGLKIRHKELEDELSKSEALRKDEVHQNEDFINFLIW